MRLHSGLLRVCSESIARRYTSFGDQGTRWQLRLNNLEARSPGSSGEAIKWTSSQLRSFANRHSHRLSTEKVIRLGINSIAFCPYSLPSLPLFIAAASPSGSLDLCFLFLFRFASRSCVSLEGPSRISTAGTLVTTCLSPASG